ncbi:MAG: hypothetical protein VKK62_01700 [Synechococcaceae cyanobacterium]|nr:hypothetical protein [Synechococcaceae cyanobacterium]
MSLSSDGAGPWDAFSSPASFLAAATIGGSADPPEGTEPIDAYFECLTTCSLEDGECVTRCVEVLRERV